MKVEQFEKTVDDEDKVVDTEPELEDERLTRSFSPATRKRSCAL